MKRENEVIKFDRKTGNWAYHITVDHTDLINNNLEAQKDGSNGWTDGREFRRIGSIPYELYADPDFKELTTEERNLFLRWFLDRNPQFRTVDEILHVDPNPGHVIVK